MLIFTFFLIISFLYDSKIIVNHRLLKCTLGNLIRLLCTNSFRFILLSKSLQAPILTWGVLSTG